MKRENHCIVITIDGQLLTKQETFFIIFYLVIPTITLLYGNFQTILSMYRHRCPPPIYQHYSHFVNFQTDKGKSKYPLIKLKVGAEYYKAFIQSFKFYFNNILTSIDVPLNITSIDCSLRKEQYSYSQLKTKENIQHVHYYSTYQMICISPNFRNLVFCECKRHWQKVITDLRG